MDNDQQAPEVTLLDLFPALVTAGAIEIAQISKRGYEAAVTVEETKEVAEFWLTNYLAKHPIPPPGMSFEYLDDIVLIPRPTIPHIAAVALPYLYRQGRPVLMEKLLHRAPAYAYSWAMFSCFNIPLFSLTDRPIIVTNLEKRMISCAEVMIRYNIYPQGFYPRETAAAQAREAGFIELAEFWETASFPGAEEVL